MNRKTVPSRTPFVWLAVLLCAIVAITILRTSPALKHTEVTDPIHEPYVPPEETGFVGSDRCAECHLEIYGSYSQHPMFNSTKRVEDDAEPPPSTSAAVTGIERSLTAMSVKGEMTHHERMHDATGDLIYDFPVQMEYVVGSGRRARAYLYQRDSLICTSPLNWFRDGGWDLNPGFTPDDPRRFNRQATAECLGCHAGRLSVRSRLTNLYNQPPFREMAIGCERCHGPGEPHIQHHREGHGEPDPFTLTRSMTKAEQGAVCYQCHFSATERVLRPGRGPTDFRPGLKPEDIWSFILTKPTVQKDGKASNLGTAHVQQMHESTCFTRSDGQMSCTSCHDPHSTPSESERVEHYRRRCLKCHETEGCSEDSSTIREASQGCIECHMPARNVLTLGSIDGYTSSQCQAAQGSDRSGSRHNNRVSAVWCGLLPAVFRTSMTQKSYFGEKAR